MASETEQAPAPEAAAKKKSLFSFLRKKEKGPESAKVEPTPKTKTAKGKGKGKKKSGPSIATRLEEFWDRGVATFKEVAGSVRSPDRPTRRMATLFLMSCAGVLVVVAMGWKRYRDLHHVKGELSESQKDAKRMGEFFQKQKEAATQRHTMMPIGEFTLELKPLMVDGAPAGPVRGVLNMAEIEIVVECDNKDTCLYLEKNLVLVRNHVTNILLPLGRDELMSREGKKKVKKAILDRINLWLPKGRIEGLYFIKLLLS